MGPDEEIEWWTNVMHRYSNEIGFVALGMATGLKLAKADYGARGTMEQNNPMTFSNGLTPEHDDKIDDLQIALVRIRQDIEALGRHRTYSLAITKIEEAEHWLRARKHTAA